MILKEKSIWNWILHSTFSNDPLPSNLCAYITKSIVSLVSFPIIIHFHMLSFFECLLVHKSWKPSNDISFFGKLLSNFALSIISLGLMIDSSSRLGFELNWTSFLISYLLMPIILILIALFTVICIAKILDFFEEYSFKTTGSFYSYKPIKKPSIIAMWYRDLKNKTCTKIEYRK